MANCAHCNKPFTCGCQKTTTSDGRTVHKGCRIAAEKKK